MDGINESVETVSVPIKLPIKQDLAGLFTTTLCSAYVYAKLYVYNTKHVQFYIRLTAFLFLFWVNKN